MNDRQIMNEMRQDELEGEPLSLQRPEWLKRFLAILFGIGLAWIMSEALLRIAYPLFPYTIQAALREVRVTPFSDKRILPQQIWQPDSRYQLISRSDIDNQLQFPDPRVAVRVTTKNWLDPNSHVGFRVPSSDWEPVWPVDAVVVGDSFSFCYTEYDACWVQRLNNQYGMSVVNLGQVATGSISHLNLLNTFGLPYQPSLVIWQWYGNDYNDDYGMALMNGELGQENDIQPQTTAPRSSSRLTLWLEKNSAVYWIIQTFLSSEADRYKYERFVDPYRAKEGELEFTFGRPYILKAFDMSNPDNQTGQKLSQQAILDASEHLKELGISLVIVLVPTKEEVYSRWTEEVLGEDQLQALGLGRQQMMAFCDDHELRCFDSTLALTAHAESGRLVFAWDDIHLNDQGNQILADSVWKFLVENELLATSGP